jgi:ribose/xylose/arabinose/galactoside ABC-type transport system permease subunit
MRKIISNIAMPLRKYPIAGISILFFIIMSVFVPKFFTPTNLANVGAQLSYVGIGATGLAFILIGGGMDISTGTAMSLSGILSGLVMAKVTGGMSTVAGIVTVLAVGIACGALNGFFIAKLQVNSFMMTLITQMAFMGMALWLTNSKSVTGIPDAYVSLGSVKIGGVPISLFLLLIFFILGQLFLTKTGYGRRLFATGANARAARLVGINTFSILFRAYLFGGFCNAVAAVILVGKLGVANPAMGNDLFLDIMSAAVIGGCSLFGGKGSVVGTAFGVLLIGLISNGLSLLGVEYQATTVVKGTVILAAIVLDTIQSRLSARRMLESSTSITVKDKETATV